MSPWESLSPSFRALLERILTRRQLVHLRLWTDGYSTRKVAAMLGISQPAVVQARRALIRRLERDPDIEPMRGSRQEVIGLRIVRGHFPPDTCERLRASRLRGSPEPEIAPNLPNLCARFGKRGAEFDPERGRFVPVLGSGLAVVPDTDPAQGEYFVASRDARAPLPDGVPGPPLRGAELDVLAPLFDAGFDAVDELPVLRTRAGRNRVVTIADPGEDELQHAARHRLAVRRMLRLVELRQLKGMMRGTPCRSCTSALTAAH